MRSELIYSAAACNRTPNICDWGKNNLICYGSCNSVVICDPKKLGTNKNFKILIGHTKIVNSVKWIPCENESKERELISASNDGTAIIWSLEDNEYKFTKLMGHESGVNVIGAIYINNENGSLLISTASTDSTIKLWHRNNFEGDVTCTQTIDLNRGFCLSLSLTYLPRTNKILIASARDTSTVQLFTQFEENGMPGEFRLVETLKGHANWVQGVDIIQSDNGNLLLASCSQDTFIRLWCISPNWNKDDLTKINETKSDLELLTCDTSPLQKTFCVVSKGETQHFKINLESVLCGHEGWVYEVKWAPKIPKEDGTYTQPMKLLSASLDKTMLIWTYEESTKLWMESVRVGEVGGNTLGFYGCKFAPDGLSMISHGYLGTFHLWNYNTELSTWQSGVNISGHFNEVVDIAWEPKGEYLISVSLDQTTRLHAPWIRDNEISWHEIARPQVHGYDMCCLAVLSRYIFVSGAEEKIIRAFKAPSNFVSNFRNLCKISVDKEGEHILNKTKDVPRGASVPSLGLSNKAVYEESNEDLRQSKRNEYYPEETYFHEVHLEVPPTEEDLIQNTLWPEIQKLYGHGYELFALAASSNRKLIASACKSTTVQHAAIILWDTETWQIKQKLTSHTLTVTRLAFSQDSNKLLSVSRDRRWCVFEKNTDTNEFELVATTDKKTGIHSRIIWCCAWVYDSQSFITVSRDGKAVIWTKNDQKQNKDSPMGLYEALSISLEFKGQSITAVAVAPVPVNDSYLFCFGFESGEMEIWTWNLTKSWMKYLHINKSSGHHLAVKRLCFRPCEGEAGVKESNKRVLQLASCSCDYSVKIHNIFLNE